MRSLKPRFSKASLKKKLERAYRYSELRKFKLWLKGKTLHWAFFLMLASLLLSAVLGLHYYRLSFFYVVGVEGLELGTVRDGAEVEQFLDELTAKCSSFYGMPVEPEQKITLLREYRTDGENNIAQVKEALRRQIRLTTKAVMLTVNQVPVIPMSTEEEINEALDLLTSFYIGEVDNKRLLKVTVVDQVAAVPCSVSPESVCTPGEAAVFLRDGRRSNKDRLLADRLGNTHHRGAPAPEEGTQVLVRVQTIEEVESTEIIPYKISYRYTDKLWYAQSRVVVPGKAGRKKLTYHVTYENGREIARQKIKETVLEEPVARVVEKGTARAPAVGSGRFLWPVQGGRISSGFRTASRPGHNGVDIYHPAGRGTPILAADDGVVVETGSRYPLGNYVVLYHGRYYTLYAHNQVNKVSAGCRVKRGERIALMGNTGRTRGITGIHLHFEVRLSRGSWSHSPPVNPLDFFH